MAGAATTVITPPVGVDLCGFGNRPGPSDGVHDDLQAAALYVEAGQRAILMTADLIGIDPESMRWVRDRIAEATDVPGANVMLTCSHTHAGPAMPCIYHLGDPDAQYIESLRQKLAAVAIEAWRRRAPARWAAGRAPVQVGINRREARGTEIALGENPLGVCGKHVDAVRVESPDGAPLAIWMCHPAHAVVMGGDNTLISADWPGYARQAVEQMYPGAVALFAQGCCGNINCNWRNGWDVAERLGVMLAEAVREALEDVPATADAQVAVASETVALPLQDPPPADEARADLQVAVQAREEGWDEANYGVRMMLDGGVAWCEQIVELAAREATGLTLDYEVQVVRVGDLAVVGLPGEVFVEYALNIEAASPCAQTAVAAYTNDSVGYVPTAAAYDEGGYEVLTAIRYYGKTMLAPETEGVILDAAKRLLSAACGGN